MTAISELEPGARLLLLCALGVEPGLDPVASLKLLHFARMARLSLREGLDLPRVEPRVTFQYDDVGRLHATLRFPTPLDRVSRTEQAILKSVLDARQSITI